MISIGSRLMLIVRHLSWFDGKQSYVGELLANANESRDTVVPIDMFILTSEETKPGSNF